MGGGGIFDVESAATILTEQHCSVPVQTSLFLVKAQINYV